MEKEDFLTYAQQASLSLLTWGTLLETFYNLILITMEQ